MAKLIAHKGNYDVQIQEYPIPEPMDDGVLLKVEAAGICGSDSHFMQLKDAPYYANLGHEFTGKVVAMGKNSQNSLNCYNGTVAVGDRLAVYPWVTCAKCHSCLRFGNGLANICENPFVYGAGFNEKDPVLNHHPDQYPYFKGGFGEYVHLFPNTYVWKVPDDMPPAVASLLDPCGVAMRAVEQTMTAIGGTGEGFSLNSTVLIVGAGAIGIMTGIIFRAMGAKRLILSDMLDKKLEMAKAICKADDIVNVSGMTSEERIAKIIEMTNGGANIVVNCANHAKTSIEALQMVRTLGTYVEVGNASDLGSNTSTEKVNIPRTLFMKNAHVTSVVANTPQCFDRAFGMLRRWKELGFDKLITHEFHSLDEFLPTIKKMRDEDYLKGVLVLKD